MKKVAIMTINSINFGNRLQNYALQEIIHGCGYEVETIRRTHDLWANQSKINAIKDILRMIKGTRKGLYIRFDNKYIHYSKYHALSDEVEENINSRYDYFVVGSDQVWNPYYKNIVGKSDLLLFTSGEKKISYAASFGIDSIPIEKVDLYRKALGDFKAISVREKAGAEIVRDLIGKEVQVLLDPTLLLSSDQWRELRRRPKYVPNGKYALVYMLGGQSVMCTQYINELREKCGFKIYDILAKNKYGKAPAIGPSEFLYLIEFADIIISDSFHATVFSILFHKNARIYNRGGIDMSSRIATLTEILDLENYFTSDGIFFVDSSIDFGTVDAKLEVERKECINYLIEALA